MRRLQNFFPSTAPNNLFRLLQNHEFQHNTQAPRSNRVRAPKTANKIPGFLRSLPFLPDTGPHTSPGNPTHIHETIFPLSVPITHLVQPEVSQGYPPLGHRDPQLLKRRVTVRLRLYRTHTWRRIFLVYVDFTIYGVFHLSGGGGWWFWWRT